MLQKLRRASQRALVKRKDSAVTLSHCRTNSVFEESGKATFFDLPAELRNVIYEYVALDTVLIVPAKKAKQTALPPSANLLLVNKKTRQEFKPILLATATVVAKVKDYNFRNLVRVLSSLSRTDLLALHANSGSKEGAPSRLAIHLVLSQTAAPTYEEPANLRSTWLLWMHACPYVSDTSTASNDGLARTLPWFYCMKWKESKSRFAAKASGSGFDMTHVLLRAHRTVIIHAHADVEGPCRDEHFEMLDAVQRVYEGDDELGRRDLRRGMGRASVA